MNKDSQEKLEKIEELINYDLKNGKALRKKVSKKIQENGHCVESFCGEVQSLKAVK